MLYVMLKGFLCGFLLVCDLYILNALLSSFDFHSTGTVEVLEYPSLQTLQTLVAHTAGCYCIAIDPTGRFFLNLSLSDHGFFSMPL